MNRPREHYASEMPHVLIVTSDEELHAFLAEGLTLGGFWVSTVASGLQAIEVFRLRSFDLVLIDAAVQGFGGLEVVRRLRGHGREKSLTDVPILMLAGGPGEVDEFDVTDAGADRLIVAPVELEELIPMLFVVVREWRLAYPGRPWADAR